MKIGILNELLENISFSYHFTGTELVPKEEIAGDPVKGELLQIRWTEIRDEDVSFDLTLPQAAIVDTVVLHIGPKTKLQYAKLFHGDQQLYCHRAETGKNTTSRTIRLEAGAICDKLSLVLSSDFSSIQLEKIEILGALMDGVDIFPTPKEITISEGIIPLSAFTGCCADCEEAANAPQYLWEKLAERTPLSLCVKGSGNIRFMLDASLPVDAYTLETTPAGAKLCASNLRGFVMAAETFVKLVQKDAVPAVTITDSPFQEVRGVHLFIPSMEKMDFAKRLIKYLISPMGYNVVFLQVSGGMIYERHPKISQAFAHAVEMRAQGWPAFPHNGIAEGKPITKAQLKEYVAYIRSFGIEVIPEIQSLAHVQYITHAYPEIAEIPEIALKDNVDTTTEDKLPSTFYHHDYCPSNPRTYEILFDIIDEIIEVFEPKEYIHMGHDEVRSIGVCPRCKGKTPAELFAYDVNKIYNYLKSKGLKMMMWADMLQPMPKYPTSPAIDQIPKDIVLLDFIWYFHLDKDIEDNLLEKGFPVLIGNLYSSHFPRYASRIRKKGMHGGQISAWVATNEYELQKEGKLYDLCMTAQPLWAESYSENYRLLYDRMISAAMPRLREDLNNIRYPSRTEGAKVSVIDGSCVGQAFDSLRFYHSATRRITRQPWLDLDVVGKYVITYADGETEEIPITYGGNIGYRGRRQNAPLPHSFYRHTGYTATYYSDSETVYDSDGKITTTYIYEYLPRQKKVISSITLWEDPAFAAKIYLEKIEGCRL